MSKTPWTPGPWKVDGDDESMGVAFIEIRAGEITTDSYSFVCDVRGNVEDGLEINDIDRANARLIAEAPAMAEALLALLDGMQRDDGTLVEINTTLRATVAALQLDIAKVEADAKEFLAERDTLRATVAQLREALENARHYIGLSDRALPEWNARAIEVRDSIVAILANAKGAGE